MGRPSQKSYKSEHFRSSANNVPAGFHPAQIIAGRAVSPAQDSVRISFAEVSHNSRKMQRYERHMWQKKRPGYNRVFFDVRLPLGIKR